MTTYAAKLQNLRAFITDKTEIQISSSAGANAAWLVAAGRLSACFAGEPELWEREARWVTAALNKNLKQRPMPSAWWANLTAHAHLTHLATHASFAWRQAGEPDHALIASQLGTDLSGLVELTLYELPMTRETFAALWANPTLTKLKTIKLTGTGMCDAWLPDLLAAEAAWTALTALHMNEPKIKAGGAALLAASPRMEQLTMLSLKGCMLGPTGRKALGASPYLSDKNKARNKAVATVSNEEAEAAPPAPSDVFGDARSWVQRMDEVGWERLCDLLDRLHHSPQQDQLSQELLPYLDGALSRWPDALRMAPLAWTDALMDGKAAPREISLARAVRLDGLNITVARAKALVTGAAERGLSSRALSVRGTTLSGKALRALWPLCAKLEALELDCADQGDALYEALQDKAAPAGLTRLRVLGQQADPHAIAAAVHKLPALRTLRLGGSPREFGAHHPPAEGWAALFEAPCFGELRELEVRTGLVDAPLLEAMAAATRDMPALEQLMLGTFWSRRMGGAHSETLARWIARSPRLHTLEVGDHWGLTGARLGEVLAPAAAPALRSLALCAEGVADDGAARRWVASRAGTLERLVIEDSQASRMTGGDPANIFARSLLYAALTEGAALRELSCWLGVNGLGLRGWALDRRRDGARLESLRLVGGGTAGDAAWLVNTLELPALRTLRLTSTRLTGEVVDSLISAPCWQRLTTLELRYAYSAPEQLDRLLTALPPRLEALVVEQPTTTEEGWDGSAVSRSLTVTDAWLAALPATLRRLALVGCGRLQPGQLPALIKALDRLEALEELDLSQSFELLDADIIALLEHPRVAQLHRLKLRLRKPKFPITQAIAASPRLHLEAKTHV